MGVFYLWRWPPWPGSAMGALSLVRRLRRGYQLPELLPTHCRVLCGRQPTGVHLRGNPLLKNQSETSVLREAVGYVQTHTEHMRERQLGFLRWLHLGFFCAKPQQAAHRSKTIQMKLFQKLHDDLGSSVMRGDTGSGGVTGSVCRIWRSSYHSISFSLAFPISAIELCSSLCSLVWNN